MRYRKIDKLKSSSYDGTAEDWTNILRYTLISKVNSGIVSSVKDNLDVTCNKLENASRSSLVILFRTRVQEITHKLGAIELPETSDRTDDVDLFGWTCQTIDRRDELETVLAESAADKRKGEETILSLEQQLEDLIKAKKEHEKQLLARFARLLNEKKLQIRDQRRRLAESEDDPENRARTAGKKRKAGERSATTSDGEPDDTDDFESMVASEQRNGLNAASDHTEGSFQNSDIDHNSEDEDATRAAPRPTEAPEAASHGTTPPPRTLSFTKQADVTRLSRPNAVPSGESPFGAAGDDDDDTVSEDDEL